MKILKGFLATLAVLSIVSFSNMAHASGTAVVDLEKILGSYQKAQDVSADMKVQEAELQKFLADAEKQLQNAKTPVDKKNLETKLSNEFKLKSDKYRDNQIQKWKEIEDTILGSIKTVSTVKNYDIVLKKSSVIMGGCDITDDVLNILNAPAAAPTTPKKKK
ncbi:MAG: OmpH family outer membrane protein [Candidatus Gastranaerophilaceae bacterium]|jgi:outer membrane protein